MEINNRLLNNIINGIQEKKGKNITIIDLKDIPGVICDFFVICEGNSPTQVAAVANSIEHMVKTDTQESPIRVHGQQIAEWIGIDYGDIIVHVFLPEMRSYYNIDHLWSNANTVTIPTLD